MESLQGRAQQEWRESERECEIGAFKVAAEVAVRVSKQPCLGEA